MPYVQAEQVNSLSAYKWVKYETLMEALYNLFDNPDQKACSIIFNDLPEKDVFNANKRFPESLYVNLNGSTAFVYWRKIYIAFSKSSESQIKQAIFDFIEFLCPTKMGYSAKDVVEMSLKTRDSIIKEMSEDASKGVFSREIFEDYFRFVWNRD